MKRLKRSLCAEVERQWPQRPVLERRKETVCPNTVSDPVVNQSENICNNSICAVILFAYVKFFVVVSVVERTADGYICHVTRMVICADKTYGPQATRALILPRRLVT
jgi:hypothetical protein